MKLSRIKAACKPNQTCIILQDTKAAQQWICNGEAAYKLEGIWVDEPSMRAIFDIPAKKWQEDWSHQVIELSELEAEKAEMLSAVWESHHEIELEPCDVRILWKDEYRRFLTPDKRTVWAVASDFGPLRGDRYALRTAPGSIPVIAVYNDLLCEGVVQVLSVGAAMRLDEELSKIINAEVYDG